MLDALRQPLETGKTVIARANQRIFYPSRIQLIAAMNPCRCGRGRSQLCLLPGAMLEEIAAPDRAGLTLLREAADALSLSARGYHRTLRVARTLADLDGEEAVARIHMPKP